MNRGSSPISPTATATAALAGLLLALAWFAVGSASAATLSVCPHACVDAQVSDAVAAARRTTISGGGPVITVGAFGATTEPTVANRGVTITGGVTGTSPQSMSFLGADGAWAAGGGVEIPPNAALSGGATVTVSNSVITGNRVAPTTSVPGPACPGLFPSGSCPVAAALGGGIDSWGTLTVQNSPSAPTARDRRRGVRATPTAGESTATRAA